MKILLYSCLLILSIAFANGQLTCTAYCDTMMSNCAGYYTSNTTCLDSCSKFARPGSLTDTQGNTLGCRIYYAKVGGGFGCYYASASGGDVCVDVALDKQDCDTYCGVMATNCKNENRQYYRNCSAQCEVWVNSNKIGSTTDATGNTLSCRIHHGLAAAASVVSANLHCFHGGPFGGLPDSPVCGSTCENYCDNMMAACPSEFSNVADCLKACNVYPRDGTLRDLTGDTWNCRANHALLAVEDPYGLATNDNGTVVISDSHCSAASRNGGKICTGVAIGCAYYCQVYYAQCNTENGPFMSIKDCLTQCDAYPGPKFTVTHLREILASGTGIKTYNGNSQVCRILQIHRIFHPLTDDENSNDPRAAYCPSAGPSGGEYCGSICDNYCSNMAKACPSAFLSTQNCLDTCQTWATTSGQMGDVTGNNVYCHQTFSYQALLQYPAVQLCVSAGINSAVCTDPVTAEPPISYTVQSSGSVHIPSFALLLLSFLHFFF